MKKLDLHGTRHDEVYRTLENFLYEHIQKGTDVVEIITGNSPDMKAIVMEIAKDYKMGCREKWGNFGVLIIEMI